MTATQLTRTRERRTAAVPTDDGALLHAVVDGAEDAPVTLVLAHGWTLSQAAWDDVAALLAPRVAAGALRLVRYDQRGHGRSRPSRVTIECGRTSAMPAVTSSALGAVTAG